MRFQLLLILGIGILSLGASTFNTSGGFEYEADLKIYDREELNVLKPGILSNTTDSSHPMCFLYGWVRLKSWPRNPVTIIPRCELKAWNDNFSVILKLSSLNQEKSEILIPIGTSINDKDFVLKIK